MQPQRLNGATAGLQRKPRERVFRFFSWILAGTHRRTLWRLSARPYSNALLKRYLRFLGGDVVNVSGWMDSDKAGACYQSYFGQLDSYTITNIEGQRGMPADPPPGLTWLFLDLEKPIESELRHKFDVVLCHTVLEHIFDFATALENLAELSRDVVVIVVPFSQGVHYSDSYGDYLRFSPYFLERFFGQRGFSTLLCDSNDQPFSPVYVTFIASRHPARHPRFSSAPRRYDISLTVGRFGGRRESGLDNVEMG